MTEETNASNRDSAGTATGSEDGPTAARALKVTVVGDSGTGKTCLLMTFANNKFPEDDVCCQSLFENSKGTIRVGSESSFEVPVTMESGGECLEFGLTDTIGTEDYRSLRGIFAAKSDIFLVCFSVTEPETLENVRNNWLQEIRTLTPGAPFILVGTKTDLRNSADVKETLKSRGAQPVSMLQGIKLAKQFGAKEYVECSALDMIGVKEVFSAVAMVTDPNGNKKRGDKRKSEHNHCTIS